MAHLQAKTVRLWYRVHKWTSLICTALLLVACVTGLPLVFHDELDTLLEPHARAASVPEGTPRASVDPMLAAAEARFPALHPFSIAWDDDEPRVFVNMSPVDQPKDGEVKSMIFDAHTGSLLEVPQDRFDLTSFLLQLHSEIFLGLPGELTMGLMSLTFVISLVSGALVYGPFMRRLDFGTYRREGARRTRWFDLHNLLGIVTLTWAFVVGATGVMNALSAPLFGLWRAQTLPQILKPYHGRPVPSHFRPVQASVDAVAASLPQMEVAAVLFPNKVFGSPRHFVVWAKGKTPLTSRMETPTLVDVETGALIHTGGLPWYLRGLELSRPLHFGDYGGLPLKILWGLFDAVLIVVLVSGVYLWLSKRKTPLERDLNRLVERETRKELQEVHVA
ncbi:PepSY-associated TM helix domain-containing protein [Silvibacterium dinghuense]|uniref:PepSY domain-containing protein n=1 Tax=Silvibacterium dinghuense TaxID=1560006 RepID=A0A4Q1SAC5_9BACT|nr:PepSY-associated TM helix domain-containing protein [Silvibacterium dinghuense]RXS93879.1 PepSY domain-containing protein [Silvibacterium dinghuense]GGH08433.1 membrane protein [Silvibacterium dinghuense]